MSSYSASILERIEEAHDKCQALAGQIKLAESQEIEEAKKQLAEMFVQFDSFEIDDEKYEAIRVKVDGLMPSLNRILNECKSSLLEDNEYELAFKPISIDVFGLFNVIRLVGIITFQ